MPASPSKLRVLFFAEAVTLAHVARPVTLARALDPARFDVHLAWDDRYQHLFPNPPTTHAITSIPTAQFTRALAKGTPIYRLQELRDYVERDLQVIREVKPDVIVGDFRLSLAISAPVAGVPHLALANAYWSPFARIKRYPMPDHPLNRIVGRSVAGVLFNLFRPLAFARYARPINRLRAERGLPTLGELRNVYTHGDQTLYCDIPEMADLDPLPPNHHFIGPVLWSPRIDPPTWWDSLPQDRPIIYVNLGSSGNASLLPAILESLATVDATVIAATAGAPFTPPAVSRAFTTDYLPGDLACQRAALVICNGGSPATQQALAAAKPVIGVPGNLDQCLNMLAVTRRGAGLTVQHSRRFRADIHAAATRLLGEARAINQAKELAAAMARFDSGKLLAGRLESADKR